MAAPSAKLDELCKASCKINKWDAAVFHPHTDKYEYQWQGKPRVGENFICTLVTPGAPEQYCLAMFKKTQKDTPKFNQAKDTYTAGTLFQMSKVSLQEDITKQYVNPANKNVVNLALTNMQPAVGTAASTGAVQPCPMTTVAKCAELSTSQFFDVTALVQGITPDRELQNDRVCFAVEILDGSRDSTSQKVKVMPLTLFFDKDAPEAAASRTLLQNLRDGHQAASFFRIQGSIVSLWKPKYDSSACMEATEIRLATIIVH